MQFHEQQSPNTNLITRIEDQTIWLGQTKIDKSSWITAKNITLWHESETADQITFDFLQPLIDDKPELIIIGLSNPNPFALIKEQDLIAVQRQGIGIEIMQLQSACHTYNLLVNEGRKTILAVLLKED